MKSSLALIAILFFGACARSVPTGPPEVAFGKQECARCGMIISEERHAAGFVDEDGRSVAFDDLGELLALIEERPELRAKAWARDLEGAGWLKLPQAHLERVPGLGTPMGTGWAAFVSRERAAAFLALRRPPA